jgi:hypothetical protein
MMIDIPRLFASEFDADRNDSEWRLGVTLWLKSFHQVPAASLPDDDVQLAGSAAWAATWTWRKSRDGALRGWIKADDGLLYHPFVAEIALEAWLEKLTQRLSSGAGNAARWGSEFDPEPIKAEIASRRCCWRRSIRSPRRCPNSKPRRPCGGPAGIAPTAIPPGSQRDVPSGSQGKGREGNRRSSDPDGSAPDAPLASLDDLDPLAELRALPVAKGCWRLAVKVLVEQGHLSDPKARAFVGKLKSAGLGDDDLWQIAEAAFTQQTEDPQAYLVKAAQGVQERRGEDDALLRPSEFRQRAWMTDFTESPRDWRDHERGPPPGQLGCRVTPEIQREFGVEPARPEPVERVA